MKPVKPYGVIEIEDPKTKRIWLVNSQSLKEYQGGDLARLTRRIMLNDSSKIRL